MGALCCAPGHAQMTIPAPAGWTVQTRASGAKIYTPPDLKSGESYSVTIYESAPLSGKTLEEFVRASGGKVGKGAGQLVAPLQIHTTQGRVVTGSGVYNGPGGRQLGVMIIGVSLDGGGNIHLERTLFSGQGVFERYKGAGTQLMSALAARAKAEAGRNIEVTPSIVSRKFKTIGGPIVPGVYAGNQFKGQELFNRFRIYLYANGEYRMCDQNDEDIKERYFDEHVGKIGYNRNSGALSVDWSWGLGFHSDGDFCYYGLDQNGKPAIYAEENTGFSTKRTALAWVAPPTKRLAKSQVEAAQAAANAEKERFKWVTKPGQGVQSAQIAAVVCNSVFSGGGMNTDVYLLLKDGSIYADLPVPPDELDTQKSKQKEPDKWGKWRKGVKGDYLVSWNGAKYETLPGFATSPAPSQTKLQGRWGTGTSSTGFVSSFALWGVSFDRKGRFVKDRRGGSSSIGLPDMDGYVPMTSSGYDDNGSYAGASGAGYAVSSSTKRKNPNGAREGDYSLSGYVLTLRYDNGKVARLPFFFFDKNQKTLYFEGSTMSKDDGK